MAYKPVNLRSMCTRTEGKSSLIISWTIMVMTFMVSPMESPQANNEEFLPNSQGVRGS